MKINLLLSVNSHQQLGPELKVHRVVMIPAPTPDEAMTLKDTHKFKRHTVLVLDGGGLIFAGIIPFPVIGFGNADVYCDTIRMCAQTFAAADVAPIKCASGFSVGKKVRIVLDFPADGPQAIGSTVNRRELHFCSESIHRNQPFLYLSRRGPVHQFKQLFTT